MSSQKEPSFVYLEIDELGQFSTWIQAKVIFCCCTHSSQHVNIYINIEAMLVHLLTQGRCVFGQILNNSRHLFALQFLLSYLYLLFSRESDVSYIADWWLVTGAAAHIPSYLHWPAITLLSTVSTIYTSVSTQYLQYLHLYLQYLQYLHLYLLTSRSCCCGARRRALWRWWWKRSSHHSTETSRPRVLLQHPHFPSIKIYQISSNKYQAHTP